MFSDGEQRQVKTSHLVSSVSGAHSQKMPVPAAAATVMLCSHYNTRRDLL